MCLVPVALRFGTALLKEGSQISGNISDADGGGGPFKHNSAQAVRMKNLRGQGLFLSDQSQPDGGVRG